MGIPFKGGKRRKPLPGEPVWPRTSIAVRPDERWRLETRFRKAQCKWPRDALVAWQRQLWAWTLHREAATPLTDALYDLQPVAFAGETIREAAEASGRYAALATRVRFTTPDFRPLCFPSKEHAEVEIGCKIAELAAVVHNVTRTAVARDAALLSLAGLAKFHYRGPSEAGLALVALPRSPSARFCRRWLAGEAFEDPFAEFAAQANRIRRVAELAAGTATPGATGKVEGKAATDAPPSKWILDLDPNRPRSLVIRAGDDGKLSPLMNRRKSKASQITTTGGPSRLLVGATFGAGERGRREANVTEARQVIADATGGRVRIVGKSGSYRYQPGIVSASTGLVRAVKRDRGNVGSSRDEKRGGGTPRRKSGGTSA